MQVQKRSGQIVLFEKEKIINALTKAGQATREYNTEKAHEIGNTVCNLLAIFSKTAPIPIEHIQDVVEEELIYRNFIKTARAYIRYREQHRINREDSNTHISVLNSMTEYLNRSDWRVKANANQGYSLGGLILNSSGKMTANYWLNNVYPPLAAQAHRDGDIHIGDLDFLSGYCAGWSLRTLLEEGFNGVANKISSNPPKHMSTAINQMVNFLGTLQNEWAGAQAFSGFDTYLSPYVRIDNLNYNEVKQHIQEFIFSMNVSSRWGNQSVFSNVTMDTTILEDISWHHPKIGGVEVDFTYGDLQVEMDMINKAFIEIMLEGDSNSRTFPFPIPTYNITKNFPWNHPNTELLFELTAKYGTPYFQNFINSDLNPKDIRSLCCRLQLDMRELMTKGNGLFGSGESTGSVGLSSLNMARLGYRTKGNKILFYSEMDRLLEYGKEVLELKRKTITRWYEMGLYPYTKRYLKGYNTFFSTIGINGMNECILNFTNGDHSIVDEYGHSFAIEMLNHLRDKMIEFQQETGHMYNCEAVPGESLTYRFARLDQKKYPGIIQAGTPEAPYYTNSTQLPVDLDIDLFEALKHQEPLLKLYTGGSVEHVFIGERMPNAKSCKNLVKKILTNFKIPYITITPSYSICPVHGYITGGHKYCPQCDSSLVTETINQEAENE